MAPGRPRRKIVYPNQLNRVISHYVQANRKLVPVTSSAQTLWDASFMIKLGQLLKLAREFALFEPIVEQKGYALKASYTVLSISSEEFIDALKYFAYLSYVVEFQKTPNIPIQSVRQWQAAAESVFATFKINLKKPLSKITLFINQPNKPLTDKQYEILYDSTKLIRDAVYAKKSKVLADPAANANLRMFLGKILAIPVP